jgi:hypothetical protein
MGNKVLFGNNEDNQKNPNETFIAFIPRQEVPRHWSTPGVDGTSMINGYMLLGVRSGNRLFPQGGVNDKGLCYDINYLPPVPFKKRDGVSWRMWFNAFDILWNCNSIDEVEQWYLSHQLSFSTWEGGQFHFADSTGNAMVMNVGDDGDFVFTRKEEGNYLASTNFNLDNKIGGYPCQRFDIATKKLQEITEENQLTVNSLSDVLHSARMEYKDGVGTVYSNIFDLVNMKAYIYHLHNFSETVEFDLLDELSRYESNEDSKKYTMDNGDLFSRFEGVRIHLIADLFS